jgi:glycerol-3-phosphate cytidylyltransferase
MIKVIYTSGAFDLPHYGHLRILQRAKALGDYLIVGVSTDRLIKAYKDLKPIISYKDRAELIVNFKCVDKVIPQNSFFDVEQLRPYNISIIVLGNDWENKPFPELTTCLKELNIKMKFVPYTKRLSTSKIKERIIKNAIPIIKAQSRRK